MHEENEASEDQGLGAVVGTGDTVAVKDLLGFMKYVYVRPQDLQLAKDHFADTAIVNADWRMKDEPEGKFYCSTIPMPIPPEKT